MISMLRSLFAHQAWADIAILSAVRAHSGAYDDSEVRTVLHHIVMVQRFFLSQITGRPFDMQSEGAIPDSQDALEQRYHEAHAGEQEFLSRLDEVEAARVLDLPVLTDIHPTVAEALTQVILHSQGHRAQCATRLRQLGTPIPPTDYILWLKDRPAPVDRGA